MVFVNHRFELSPWTEDYLKSMLPPFGYNGFGEFIFYRTYSRIKKDGGQEDWADCVIRVVNGTFSIRKDWYLKNRIHWDEDFWQQYARRFAVAMYKMQWLPPGRGLWAMGSDFVYQRGAMALYNCAYTDITTVNMADDFSWMMDSLMHGVGVGFGPHRCDTMSLFVPKGSFDFVIEDTRESWCQATKLLILAYIRPGLQKPRMIYDLIRPAGMPIRGFGGVSSGPGPLKQLHLNIEHEAEIFQAKKEYDSVYYKTNIANHIGKCVVAGNVRRSAEIAIGRVSDPTFMDLKNYDKYPEREAFGWMSNNSVELYEDTDFEMLGEIASRVIRNGEPGYINRQNMPFGRLGKKMKGLRRDQAVGLNPCGEIPLEHRETCNISETLPTVCETIEQWYAACEFATMYSSTVALLPTHQPSTNRVVARNRRIGISIIDISGWKLKNGVHKITHWMREGYNRVRNINNIYNDEAGVPRAIRVTTVKPGGTVPKLPGRTSGVGYPTFRHTLRRVRVAKNSPVHPILVEANVPYEPLNFDSNTDVFEFPILQGPAKPANEATVWEQAMNLVLVQREWADNAVSNTLYFKPKWALIECITENHEKKLAKYIGYVEACHFVMSRNAEYMVPERYKITAIRDDDFAVTVVNVREFDPRHEEDDIEAVLSSIAPVTKSVSLLPHSAKGAYPQMPEEGISEDEYHLRLSEIAKIDWSNLSGSDGEDDLYCSGDTCILPRTK